MGSVMCCYTPKPAQNLLCRPRFTVCLRTNSSTFCHHEKLYFPFIYSRLRYFTREYGVLGGECSNHSVPTILFNDLAQLSRVGLFHVRDFCGTSPRFMPQICLFCPPPPACQPTMLCLPLRLVAQPLGRLTGDACRWSCIRFSRTATARRGSESMRSFWQFKSFPVSMPFKHF